jgi:hypothetical protein
MAPTAFFPAARQRILLDQKKLRTFKQIHRMVPHDSQVRQALVTILPQN